jgi:hypothetical protein
VIIKSARIPSSHAKRIANYLAQPADNERVRWLRGRPDDLQIMGEISKLAGRQYAVRHFVVAPNEFMSQQDFTWVLGEICREYDVSAASGNRASIVEHVKPRTTYVGNEKHWHLAFPEHDTETDSTLSSSFYKIRNEMIARLSELVLGHEIIPGRFNRQVYQSIKAERPEVELSRFEQALRLAACQADMDEENWLDYRAKRTCSDTKRFGLKD